MEKCNINDNSLKIIRSKVLRPINNYLLKAKREKINPEALKVAFIKALNEISNEYYITDEVVNTISEISQKKVGDIIPDFFTDINVRNILTISDSYIQEVNPKQADANIITADNQVRLRTQANNNFLYDAYGKAIEVQIAATNQMSRELFDALFINRGSFNGKQGIVSSNIELNNNIREYQQVLLERICKYLQIKINDPKQRSISSELKQLINNPQLYRQENGKWVNTNILDKLYEVINQNIIQITPMLSKHYSIMRQGQSQEQRQSSKTLLDAYNAVVLLRNFDTYLVNQLSKSIKIKDFNVLSGENKYMLSNTSGNLATTWRISENINVEEEIDGITKMAINTTPLRNNGTLQIRQDQYLRFQDFQHIIARIKELGIKNDNDIIFNEDNYDILEQLSTETQQYLKGKTLNQAINFIRRNPREYIPHIFEILSNQDFQQKYNSLFNSFSQDELDKLWSISRGIFNGSTSLASIQGFSSSVDYISYITQAADSIFNIKFIQYYNDDGKLRARTLLDSNIFNIRRSILQTINSSNSKQIIDWNQEKQKLDFYTRQVKDISGKQIFDAIVFKIPNSNIYIKVSKTEGKVQIADQSGNRFTDNKSILGLWQLDSVKSFVENTLHLNITTNSNYWDAFVREQGNEVNAVKSLINMSARTVLGEYLSNDIIKEKTKYAAESHVFNLLGKTNYRYDNQLGQLAVVHSNDFDTATALAVAKSNIYGLNTATTLKDANGNSQSTQSLSRLIGSVFSQWELQERLPSSVMSDSLLLNSKGLIDEIYTVKEINIGNELKDITEATPSEFAYSQFVLDFIGGLAPKLDEYSIFGDGKIALLPSVNSDKNQIQRLRINLNTIVTTVEGAAKPLKDFTNIELRKLIAKEFGNIAVKQIKNIQNDWRIIDNIIKQLNINLPSLAQDFVHGFVNFNAAFLEYQRTHSEIPSNLTPVQFIKEIVREYNIYNRLNPISIIDQVHYKNNNGQLAINQTLISHAVRFGKGQELGLTTEELAKYPLASNFWKLKNSELLHDLVESGFTVNVNNDNRPELLWLKNNAKGWVNNFGDLIIAKIKYNGKEIGISNLRDIVKLGYTKSLREFVNEFSNSIELNPFIEQYNLLDYLITQEFMISSVGSHAAHPDKSKSNNVLEQEASQFQAQHKRNVSFTAAMHSFQLNLLDGITEDYNIAVVEDIRDLQGTINGDLATIKPFDGATFVNPFNVILENNSLCGAKAGITKKPFIHFKDPHTGTSGIIKTAGFGLTNDWIRNSFFLQNIMQKMTNHIWLNEDGSAAIVNIFKGFKGNITYNNDNTFYFKYNDKFYKVTNIQSLGQNQYIRTVQEVDRNGQKINDVLTQETLEINSNYKLWNLFGGSQSLSLINGILQYSNISVENVVTAMNNIGTPRNGATIFHTQDQVWQPLKHVDVNYVVTEGAIKQGGANINVATSYFDDTPLDIMKIKMYQSGIQLDKEHHADNSDLSLMTQVISACASRGFTFKQASGLYEALRSVTEQNLQEHFNGIISENGIEFYNILMKSLIKTLGSNVNSTSNFIEIMASDIIKQIQSGQNIDFINDTKIPLSDNVTYSKLVSAISSFLNKTGIKQKIPGILSVLTPSYEVYKLYAGRKLESFNDFDQEIEILQSQQIPVFDINDQASSISNLELGRYYQVTELVLTPMKTETEEIVETEVPVTNTILIQTPNQYMKLRDGVQSGKILKIVESLREGRNLAAYNVRFRDIYGRNFQIWDLDSARALFTLNEIKNTNNIQILREILQSSNIYSQNQLEGINEYNYKSWWDAANKQVRRKLQHDLLVLDKNYQLASTQLTNFIRKHALDNDFYEKYSRFINVKLGTGNGNKIVLNGISYTITKENYEHLNPIIQQQLIDPIDKVSINGELVSIDQNSIVTQAYELIMPKTFATSFGLSEFDDLNTIASDQDYFIKQYLQNQTVTLSPANYTITFKKSNGRHLYVLSKEQFKNNDNLQKLDGIKIFVDEDGKKYRTDINDNIMYEITDDSEFYIDSIGNEVIVTSEIAFYLDALNGEQLQLSDASDNNVIIDFFNQLKNSNSKLSTSWLNAINERITNASNTNELVQVIRNYNKQVNQINLKNYTKYDLTHPVIRSGRSKHTSFLKSLDVICSRTPAQSQQSFMPMKVVAYDNPDINTAYVSTLQLLFQGSDYDVDAVNIATYDINSTGMLQIWSPYSNITSPSLMEASMQLPFPNSTTIGDSISTSDDIETFLRKYRNLFKVSKNDNNINIRVDNTSVENIKLLGEFLREQNNITNITIDNDLRRILEEQQLISEDFSDNDIANLLSKINEIKVKHNNFFSELSKSRISQAINNYSIYSMYQVISNPANQLEAQTALDGATAPLKEVTKNSEETQSLKLRTPGNFMNKVYSIYENQVGKQGIGICAIGLKTFFGLTQYYNTMLNQGKDIPLSHFPNAYVSDPNVLTYDQLKLLSEQTNDRDVAITLAALASLAVDNAKELELSKLNAGLDTLGMYNYCISTGMDFDKIASIFMSSTARTLVKIINPNIFSNNVKINGIQEAVNYFLFGPAKHFAKYSSVTNLLQNILKDIHPKEHNLYKRFKDFAYGNIDQKIKILEKLRNESVKQNIDNSEKINQFINFCEDYVIQINSIDFNLLNRIKDISKLANQFRIFGQILSLNQGIKTSIPDLIKQVNNIKNCMRKSPKEPGDDPNLVDVALFAFDENYRNKVIKIYDIEKMYEHDKKGDFVMDKQGNLIIQEGSFNILRAAATNPHTFGYIKTLATELLQLRQSFKFRSTENLLEYFENYTSKYTSQELEIINKGIEKYIGDYIIKSWMKYRNIQVLIPAGNKFFDKYGKINTFTEDTIITLGNDWNNATFRMYMERTVIPNLKNGVLIPGKNIIDSTISSNKFIQDLCNDTLTNTISKNPTIVYTLPINMLPRTDAERSILKQYRAEFNKLNDRTYIYNNQRLPLVEAFTYYAMIANNWRLNEKSLVPILEDFYNTGILRDFHNFESDLDNSEAIMSIENKEDFSKILPYITLTESPYSATHEYIRSINKKTGKYEIMRKPIQRNDMSEEEQEIYDFQMDLLDDVMSDIGEDYGRQNTSINGYSFIGQDVDTNYFTTGQIESYNSDYSSRISYNVSSSEGNYEFSLKNKNYRIEWKDKTISVSRNGEIVEHVFEKLPTKKIDGHVILDEQTIAYIVDSKLDPCF